jgi:orotidine-5'-phosphate decarboxylase
LPSSFGQKLSEAFERHGQLCVGIDPHVSLLDDWGLNDDVQGLDYFANSLVDACAGSVGIVKPQVSFFERHGSAGFAVLERITHRAHDSGLLVIADAKRGDIGTTMAAYLEAWLSRDSSFYADSLTVSPFLGLRTATDLLAPYLERGRGITVLVATSNPEGESIQRARNADHQTISEQIWEDITQINRVTAAGGDRFGSIAGVVGATLDFKRFGLKLEQDGVKTPILAPGFGAQGAELSDIRSIFGDARSQVIASVSRSIASAGKAGLRDVIARANDQLAAAID